MTDVFVHSVALMDTVVTFQVVGHGATSKQRSERAKGVERAVAWFRQVEECCTRFEPASEVMRLADRPGTPVPVSTILFEAVQFAVALAQETGGAFDPTVGRRMEARGFDREYRTGRVVRSTFAPDAGVSYRDVRLDPGRRTITLDRPLVLDLGAVAKGLAIDIAARELRSFENFAIDAGGDLYLGGRNADGALWSVGIRHPRDEDELIETYHVTNTAVCTSGDYARKGTAESHHIIDPRTGASAAAVASVTVIAPLAIVADALGTAAFVLGPAKGIALLERHGARGLVITPALERYTTRDA